jgi:hypothetical protein
MADGRELGPIETVNFEFDASIIIQFHSRETGAICQLPSCCADERSAGSRGWLSPLLDCLFGRQIVRGHKRGWLAPPVSPRWAFDACANPRLLLPVRSAGVYGLRR